MKKFYKRILAIMLALVMLFSYMPENIYAASFMTTEGEDAASEATENAEVYFVSAATGKLITVNGKVDDPIDCSTMYTDAESVPSNGIFKIYYATSTGNYFKGDTIVNFTCSSGTSWKATGDKVFQIQGRTNPAGWESVYMEPQGDGTVAFRSNNNGYYFTQDGETLGLVEIKEGESVSSNEKFIMYTETAPKSAKKVTLSDVAGDMVTVSWEGEKEHLYGAYEVLYSTSEDGEYVSAGYTGDTTFTVENLSLSTTYYFKVRTLVNLKGGAYTDSKIAYTTTLSNYRPKQPTGLDVQQKGNALEVSWNKANGATDYYVYRAVSRFAEYEKIGETSDTTFVDENPNDSKYKNYYKIKGVNDADISAFSEPISLETSMFGQNAYIFAPTDDQNEIDAITAEVFAKQHYSQFGDNRFAMMYKPGDYTSTGKYIEQGYYTQTLGLGKTPYDVRLVNVKTPAALSGNNVTCNFWQGIENVTIADLDNNDDPFYCFQWAVSQAAPARRLNVERTAVFDWYYGWVSGGYFADTHFHKSAGSAAQQQYYYRNCQIDGGVYGINWQQVIQGCTGVTNENSKDGSGKAFANMVDLLSGEGKTNWDQRGNTTIIDETEEIREKPFLYFDTDTDEYKVFIPAMRKNSQGISWTKDDMGEGTSISVNKYFYIAKSDVDTAATINAQLAKGKNIIFTPGVYHAEEPIKVTKANTVLLRLGMASIIPDNEEAAIKVSDVGGVSIAGLILDAGNYSKTLLTVGDEGCNKDHSENPIVLQDVIYRVGGTGSLGRADSCQVINSNDVIIDHTWIWRADHGNHVGWTENTSKNGLVVNGDNVTAYGLFCEHFQEYDILWRGENGKTYFLQNEKCYDPQNQDDWMSHDGTKKGYAAYKVTNNVKKHYAVGLGVYDVFINTNGASIYLDNAIEVPNTEDVLIENACIVEIANGSGPQVGINHIVNNTTAGIRTGAGNNGGYAIQRLLSYSNEQSLSLPDYYVNQGDVTVQEEEGETPTKDVCAEKDIVKEELSKDNEKPLWEMTEEDFDRKLAQAGNTEDGNKKDDNKTNSNGNSDKGTAIVTLKKGQKFTSGKFTYKITSVKGKKGNVTLVNVRAKYRKKLKKATVKATVKYKGYTFSVTAVGKNAFKKCKKLNKVTVGKNVKKINAKAFVASKKLKRITIKGKKLKKVAKTAFNKKVRKTVKIIAKNKKVKKLIFKSLKRKK